MEKIGELLNNQQLSTAENAITKGQQQQPSEIPDWAMLLITIAQDKRHDLDPAVIRLWRGKLSSFADVEICEALSLYRGEFFPSVDKIIEMIERKRLALAEQKQDLYWVDSERNNRDIERFKAEHDGKTPQQVFMEENRELIRELDTKLVNGPANKKVLDQSRVLGQLVIVLALLVVPALAQKNMYEAKWGSQGNGGGEWVAVLNQPVNQTCITVSGQQSICASGVHGQLHVLDFGGGPFLMDDEGYVFQVQGANYGLLIWTSARRPGDVGIRDFANGVH